MYYCISYLYSQEANGIYTHLPVTSEVTTDLEVAKKWFNNIVEQKKNHFAYKLLDVRERELDYMCYLKEARFFCDEAAYLKGYYLVNLSCYTFNPCA
jgi:hypothetical protein